MKADTIQTGDETLVEANPEAPETLPDVEASGRMPQMAEGVEAEEVVEGLFRVAVSLPPPPRRGTRGGEASQKLINASLGRLLSAVGLRPEISLDTTQGSYPPGGSTGRNLHRIIEVRSI